MTRKMLIPWRVWYYGLRPVLTVLAGLAVLALWPLRFLHALGKTMIDLPISAPWERDRK